MRREFKPTLRADVTRKKKVVSEEDVVVELTLMEGDSTTLHYDGSDIMDPSLVSDPNEKVVVQEVNRSYKTLDYVAVGLGTDDATDSDGRDLRAPLDLNQVKYTGIVGPTRAALFFDLSQIPSNAIIEEATLELEPIEYDQNLDLFNDNLILDPSTTRPNVWPPSGVVMEPLNLSSFANENATWNYAKEVSDPHSAESQALRWSRIGGFPGMDIVPPNPIGMMQNSKRRDYPEPQELYDDQRIDDSTPAHLGEYYGHIGYGIFGGGLIENWPLTGHEITVQDTLDTVSFDVLSQVQHGYSVNQKCNILVRASNWGANTAAENPDDQVDILPLSFDGVHISDQPFGTEITSAAQDQVIYSVPENLINFTDVTYEWYQESPIEEFGVLDTTKSTAPVIEGGTVNVAVTNANDVGGVPETNQYTFNWYSTPEGGSYPEDRILQQTITQPHTSFPQSSFTIPNTLGGSNLRCEVILDNPTDLPGESVSSTENFFTIGFDGLGDLVIDITTGPSDCCDNDFGCFGGGGECGVVENGSQIQVTCSVTGVQNPTFDYILRRIHFPDGSNDVVSLTEDSTSLQSPLYTINNQDLSVGPGMYFLVVNLKENGSVVATMPVSWSYTVEPAGILTPWVQRPEYRSGVYRLKAS